MSQPESIRRKVMRVVFLTTLAALLVNAIALIGLDIYDYRDKELVSVRLQADMLARASAAAVAFEDQDEAMSAVRLVGRNPSILAAAVYREDGTLYSSYAQPDVPLPPATAGTGGFAFGGDVISGFQSVLEPDGHATTVYLRVHSQFYDRVFRYLRILGLVMAGALAFAFVLSNRLQRAVTAPIRVVADAAKRVVERHDYSVRVERQNDYEAALLADAFNHMLAEIERRSAELQQEMRERLQAEEAIREADRNKDRFLATLAHELRNPLAPIVTSVQLLQRLPASNPAQARAQEVIDRQARHMTRLLDDLLDVARITHGKVQLQKQRLALNAVIDAAIESVKPMVDRAGHRLSLLTPEQPLYVDGDPVRLAQVFVNLLSNACKYMNAGGEIGVLLERSGEQARIVIEDAGIGIAREDLERVFGLFSQSSPLQQRADSGLGIGLFLVKTFTEMHGGSVAVDSDGIGKGTRFEVRLALAAVQGLELVAGSALREAASARHRILIADDNADAAEALAATLRLAGNDVRIALDGQGALAAAESFQPNAALLDIGMPGMDGYEVARRIRGAPWGAGIRLVAVTGWGSADDKRRAAGAGFDHHLTKPARLEEIEAILRMNLHIDSGGDHRPLSGTAP
jgi:signal transduction histidine kinase/ActR/RegA family two-component response regulator